MADIVLLAVVIVFFAIASLYVRACAVIVGRETASDGIVDDEAADPGVAA
ncbi:MAG TPA: hypothetical protein VF183_05325 [Acidimicrobiales bacterium]